MEMIEFFTWNYTDFQWKHQYFPVKSSANYMNKMVTGLYVSEKHVCENFNEKRTSSDPPPLFLLSFLSLSSHPFFLFFLLIVSPSFPCPPLCFYLTLFSLSSFSTFPFWFLLFSAACNWGAEIRTYRWCQTSQKSEPYGQIRNSEDYHPCTLLPVAPFIDKETMGVLRVLPRTRPRSSACPQRNFEGGRTGKKNITNQILRSWISGA